MKPIVAIVGRPNVGKSTLFNRLIGERRAIIEDQPGITRDRIYGDAEWNGRQFTVVDTGGLQYGAEGALEQAVVRQALLAIQEADVVVFMVDVRQGLLPDDHEVARHLRRAGKPAVVCANKVENLHHEELAAEFYALGLGDVIPVSALHGMGTGELLDRVVSLLPPAGGGGTEEEDPSLIKVAVVGRPNVGKSTLVNALAGEERVIVSEVAGTTRDAIDVLVQRGEDRFLLIDTAGMRRRARVEAPVERYSVLRALRAIERSDVVLILIDAVEGVTDQDQKIADYTREQGKGAIVVVNKWDLVEKTDHTMREYTEAIRYQLRFMDYVEIAFLSALTRARLPKLLPQIRTVWENHGRRVPTGPLNECIREAMALTPPPGDKDRRLKVYYATQVGTRPPAIVLFLNDRELLHFSYARYLENRLREAFDFRGTPIRWHYREHASRRLLARPREAGASPRREARLRRVRSRG